MKLSQIEKDIPCPPRFKNAELIEKMMSMRIGDSFSITPENDEELSQLKEIVYKAFDTFRRKKQGRFSSRTSRMEMIIRIWRIA